jgi:hypothetical protein
MQDRKGKNATFKGKLKSERTGKNKWKDLSPTLN